MGECCNIEPSPQNLSKRTGSCMNKVVRFVVTGSVRTVRSIDGWDYGPLA